MGVSDFPLGPTVKRVAAYLKGKKIYVSYINFVGLFRLDINYIKLIVIREKKVSNSYVVRILETFYLVSNKLLYWD